MKRIAMLTMLGTIGACGAPPTTEHAPSSTVRNGIAEDALPTVQLSAAAREKLGIVTGTVEVVAVPRTRLVGGEVVVPPGRTTLVTAPVAGLVKVVGAVAPGSAVTRGTTLLTITALAPADRDTRARVARELAAAEANLAALQLRVDRNTTLVEERAGSARAVEEAVAARDVAKADVDTARARAATMAADPLLSDVALQVRAPVDGIVRALSVADRQIVPGGAPLLEVVAVDALQVRVPVYGGDVVDLDTTRPAAVQHLRGGAAVSATFSAGPPTAEVDRATVDRWLTLSSSSSFAPGERVGVTLPLQQEIDASVVDSGAVVVDASGGSWVYRCGEDAHVFHRVRIDPIRTVDHHTVIAHGPPRGSCVVVVGAAELFGTEFPPGH